MPYIIALRLRRCHYAARYDAAGLFDYFRIFTRRLRAIVSMSAADDAFSLPPMLPPLIIVAFAAAAMM